jgi:integrase
MRLGEVLALSWDDVDLEQGVVPVGATIVRVKGKGLVRKTTKSATSQRVLLLPVWCVAMLVVRRGAALASALSSRMP